MPADASPTHRTGPSPRRFRALVWSTRLCAAVAVLIALPLTASFRWGLFVGRWARGEDSTVVLERGAIVHEVSGPSLMLNGGAVRWGWFDARKHRVSARESGRGPVALALQPLWDGRSGHQRRLVSLPLWIPFAAFALPGAWLWRRRRGLVRLGGCPACGYDRTGLAAAVPCPECGELLNLSADRTP